MLINLLGCKLDAYCSRRASLRDFMHVMQCGSVAQNGRRCCLFRQQKRSARCTRPAGADMAA